MAFLSEEHVTGQESQPVLFLQPALTNHWYIACASSQLGASPRAATVLDRRLVVYRDGEGVARALEDRCCHRGAQLSLGSVCDGALACAYHGWRFDGTGRCVHVPSLCEGTAIPAAFKVRGFDCIEQDHYVWVWIGDDAPPAPPSRLRGVEGHAWKQGSVNARCCWTNFLENLLDGAHFPFVHKGTHPMYFFNKFKGFQEYEYEIRVTDSGFVQFYPPTQDAAEPVPEDPTSASCFELPNRVYVFQRGAGADFNSIAHLVPTGPSRCRLEWMMRARGEETPGVEWCDDEPKLLEQDRVLQESLQTNYDREGSAFERSVPADYPTLMARKVIALALRGCWESERHTLTQRKLMRVRQ